MLTVDKISKSFGTKKAVDELSFCINKPGVYGLIGTNGAGKTTAIRCILGIMEPDSGKADWNGKKITRETLNFGYMPEERGIYAKNKVFEQLVYFATLKGLSTKKAAENTEKFLKRLNVLEYKNMFAEKLSKGNQQKIQLISAMVHDPILIFLDEPFSGLDPVNAEMLKKLISELVNEGKYIVMSSHQMSTIEEYCKDITLLHNGKTIVSGNLKEIKSGYGNTNLIISDEIGIKEVANNFDLKLVAQKAEMLEYKFKDENVVTNFIKSLFEKGIYPTKYEIKQPSLNEIFIEKVGGNL